MPTENDKRYLVLIPAYKPDERLITLTEALVARGLSVLLVDDGGQERFLTAADEPKAEFVLAEGEKALRAYEYCNLHGLWVAEVQ